MPYKNTFYLQLCFFKQALIFNFTNLRIFSLLIRNYQNNILKDGL